MECHINRSNQTLDCRGSHLAMTRKNAFTLAEVLITLGIIGVVAALTLGALIPNFEKQRNLSVLKKSYSEMQNYVLDFTQYAGCIDIKTCWPHIDYQDDVFMNEFAQYLLDKKKFTPFVPFKRNNAVYLMYRAFDNQKHKANHYYINEGNGYSNGKIDLNNGSWIPLVSPSGNYMIVIGSNNWYSVSGNYFRAAIFILTNNKKFGRKDASFAGDVEKYPNDFPRAGKDLFQFFVMQDGKIVPNGSEYCKGGRYYCNYWKEANSCNPENPDSSGTGCLSRIIEDGWQIKYKW